MTVPPAMKVLAAGPYVSGEPTHSSCSEIISHVLSSFGSFMSIVGGSAGALVAPRVRWWLRG